MCKRSSRFFATSIGQGEVRAWKSCYIIWEHGKAKSPSCRYHAHYPPILPLPPMPAGPFSSRLAADRMSRGSSLLVFFALFVTFDAPFSARAEDTSKTVAEGAPSEQRSEQPFQPRAEDQIWLVNTRGTCVSDNPAWGIARYDAGYWKGSNENAFYVSDDKETVTVIYIHGNRMDSEGA